MRVGLFIFISLFTAACGAPQREAPSEAASSARLEISDSWATPTPGGVGVSAGYLTIVNPSDTEDRLIGASSPRAERVEVHEMSMDGAVMRMRAVEDGLAIPAGATVALSPGGRHLMFYGVRPPLAEGERIPATLRFARAGDVAVEFSVRRAASGHSGH